MVFCVSSCKNLSPSAYISQDETECVSECAINEVIDFITDIDNPKCVISCPQTEYRDFITDPAHPRCVTSCKNLVPPAYINKYGD